MCQDGSWDAFQWIAKCAGEKLVRELEEQRWGVKETQRESRDHTWRWTWKDLPLLLVLLLFCFVFAFLGQTCGIWKSPGQGSNQSCSCRRTPQPWPQQRGIRNHIFDLHHSLWERWILNPEQGQGLNPHPHGN